VGANYTPKALPPGFSTSADSYPGTASAASFLQQELQLQLQAPPSPAQATPSFNRASPSPMPSSVGAGMSPVVMHQVNELQRRCALLEAHNGEYEDMLRNYGKELKHRQSFIKSLTKDFLDAEQRIQLQRDAQREGGVGFSANRHFGDEFSGFGGSKEVS